MTHDELIAYIDDSTDGLKHKHLFEKLLVNTKALRAVVELHKPDFMGECMAIECECNCRGRTGIPYPCPTIQAIEKELA